MKKVLAIILAMIMVFSMAACSSEGEQAEGNGEYPTLKLTCAGLDSADTAKAHDL